MALTLHGKSISYEDAAALVTSGIRGKQFASLNSRGLPSHLPIHTLAPKLPRIMRLTWTGSDGEPVIDERQKLAEALRMWDAQDCSLELMLRRLERSAKLRR